MTIHRWCRRSLHETRIVSRGNESDHPTHAEVLCRECRREWRRVEGKNRQTRETEDRISFEVWLDLPPQLLLYWLFTQPEHQDMTPPALRALWLTARNQKQHWMENAALERMFYARGPQ